MTWSEKPPRRATTPQSVSIAARQPRINGLDACLRYRRRAEIWRPLQTPARGASVGQRPGDDGSRWGTTDRLLHDVAQGSNPAKRASIEIDGS
jgi:hypothetical protein